MNPVSMALPVIRFQATRALPDAAACAKSTSMPVRMAAHS
jgi:hypothetical protein